MKLILAACTLSAILILSGMKFTGNTDSGGSRLNLSTDSPFNFNVKNANEVNAGNIDEVKKSDWYSSAMDMIRKDEYNIKYSSLKCRDANMKPLRAWFEESYMSRVTSYKI